MRGAVQSARVSIRSSADRSEVSLPWELTTTSRDGNALEGTSPSFML